MSVLLLLGATPDEAPSTTPPPDVRVGPLGFVALAASLDRSLGEALETVGSVLTPAEPRPRPMKIVLPVRGSGREADPRAAGYRLRRQLTQMLENRRMLAPGVFFHWEADPELDCWLRFGGGSLEETDPGVTFGEWTLELTDCYQVAAAARGRTARRLELADRRTGLVALDTRGLLYSTDHADQALPDRPLIIPGDVWSVLLAYNRPPTLNLAGANLDGRTLWRELSSADGDVASYLNDPDVTYYELDDWDEGIAGAVRVFDVDNSTLALTDQNTLALTDPDTPARDRNPTTAGWERVYGPMTKRSPQIVIDNGVCRLVWLGPSPDEGLAIERWDTTHDAYWRVARVLGIGAALGTAEFAIIELNSERVVVEWRQAERAMRAILQRGWYGPRLEAYNDAVGGTARLEFIYYLGGVAPAATAPSWVRRLGSGADAIYWATGTDDDVEGTFAEGPSSDPPGEFLGGDAGVFYTHPNVVVAQLGTALGPGTEELASLAVVDATPVPLLVTR